MDEKLMTEKVLRLLKGGGGKGNHIKKLFGFFPRWDSWKTYAEGFAFTYSVVLNLPIYHLPNSKRKVINVNDLDSRVIDLAYLYLFCPEKLYKAQSRCIRVQGFMKNISSGKYKLDTIWKNGLSKWYMMNSSFAAKDEPNMSYGIDIYRSRYPVKSQDYREAINMRLREMCIFNEDFYHFYSRFLKAKSLMVYSDPPYVSAEKTGIYKFNLNKQQHIKLADIHHQLDAKGAKICISYDDHPLIHELYEKWQFHDLTIHYSMPSSRIKTNTELVITNYKPTKQQELPNWISSL